MVISYTSERKRSDVAEGLLEKAASHFNENVIIKKSFITEDGSEVRFEITKV